jgi:hypothetical protein
MQLIDTRYGLNETVVTRFAHYQNGQTAIQLATPDGEPWLTATSAVPVSVEPTCVVIKDYSENEGVAELLVQAGVIEAQPIRHVASGFVRMPVYRLTSAALAEAAS